MATDSTPSAGRVELTTHGLEIAVYPDPVTGAPVVQIDTPGLPEVAGWPIMELILNDHTYLANTGPA